MSRTVELRACILVSGIMFGGGVVVPTVLGQVQVAKLTSTAEGADGFGIALAIDGDDAIVGAPFSNPDENPEFLSAGVAYVFKLVGKQWVESQILHPPVLSDNIEFGAALAMDGDTLVVSEPHAGFDGNGRGRVHIYRRIGDSWTPEANLVSSNFPNDHEGFGSSVAIDGNVLLAGAPGGIFPTTNRAYVFRRSGVTWTEETVLLPSDPQDQHCFGCSVDMSGDVAVVGASWDDGACPADPFCASGAAYVYRYDNGAWTQEGKLVASDAAAGRQFGTAVAIHGSDILVGDRTGIYVFAHEDGSWTEYEKLIPSDPAPIEALSTDGVFLLAGAPQYDGIGSDSGAAYFYSRSGTTLVEKVILIPKGTDGIQQFGFSVSVDGDYAVVGAADAAYVFDTSIDIPAVSEWGIVTMALLFSCAGAVRFECGGRKR